MESWTVFEKGRLHFAVLVAALLALRSELADLPPQLGGFVTFPFQEILEFFLVTWQCFYAVDAKEWVAAKPQPLKECMDGCETLNPKTGEWLRNIQTLKGVGVGECDTLNPKRSEWL